MLPSRKFPQGSIRGGAGARVIKSPQKKKLVWGNRVRRVKLDPTPFRINETNKLKTFAKKIKENTKRKVVEQKQHVGLRFKSNMNINTLNIAPCQT